MLKLVHDDRVWASLAVGAAVLAFMWFPFLVFIGGIPSMPNASFDPLGDYEMQQLYIVVLSILALIFVVIGMGFASHYLGTRYYNGLRTGLIVAGGCFLVVSLIASIDAIGYKERVIGHKSVFRMKFDKFFCNLRIKEICAQDGNLDKLHVQKHFGTTSNVTPRSMGRVGNICHFINDVTSISFSEQVFLDSCNTMNSVDKWCGHRAMGLPTNTSPPLTPFSINPEKYRSFQTEWPESVKVDSIYLGLVVGCLIVVYCLKQNRRNQNRDASEEFDLEEDKLEQKMEI